MQKEKAQLLMLQKAIEAHLEQYSDVDADDMMRNKSIHVEFYYGDTSLCVHMSEK